MAVKTIVLVTTGQPSVNPRIVKEADALQAAGHNVTVLYSFWINWAMAADIELLRRVKWVHKLIGGSPSTDKWQYLFTRLRLKANNFLNTLFGNELFFAERTQARCYDELLKAAISIKADWYIGHNLGTLPIVVKAALHNNARSGFDFEDYHREESNGQDFATIKRIIFLEKKYVPHLKYISTASFLISERVAQDFPLLKTKMLPILNCFPLTQQPDFKEKSSGDDSLQLFWFSQTIGKNRGLEVLLTALKKLNDQSIHITLAGKCDKDWEMYVEEHAGSIKNNIHFAGIIQPDKLPAFAAGFDIGLAIELAEPKNRNICLTNKLFTYLLAGNAIILSRTAAQQAFNAEYGIGESFAINNASQLEATITQYKNFTNLHLQRRRNYDLANSIFNWEMESKKLLSVID